VLLLADELRRRAADRFLCGCAAAMSTGARDHPGRLVGVLAAATS
jgi:hypothetical protein